MMRKIGLHALFITATVLVLVSCGYTYESLITPPAGMRTFIGPDGDYALSLDPAWKLITDRETLRSLMVANSKAESIPDGFVMEAYCSGIGFDLKIVKARMTDKAPGWKKLDTKQRLNLIKTSFVISDSISIGRTEEILSQDGTYLLAILDNKTDNNIIPSFALADLGASVLIIGASAVSDKMPVDFSSRFKAIAESVRVTREGMTKAGEAKAEEDRLWAEYDMVVRETGEPWTYYHGFGDGLIHGGLIPFRFIANLIFKSNYELVAARNIGFFYWAGFVIGILFLASGGIFGARRRR